MATKYGLIARKGDKVWTAFTTDAPHAPRMPTVGVTGTLSGKEADAVTQAAGLIAQSHRADAARVLETAGFAVELFEEPLGPGRPPKADADKRSQRLVFMATPDEEAAIRARVPPGRDFSDWARQVLLDTTDNRKGKPMDPNEVTEAEQIRLMEADQARHPENYPSVDNPADDGPMTREDYQQAIREWAADERGE